MASRGSLESSRRSKPSARTGGAAFGGSKATGVLLKFTPDPKLGYPKHYRRDVAGQTRRLALDVIRLEPRDPGASIPPIP